MKNYSKLGLPALLLCFCFMLTFSSLYAQKDRTARQERVDKARICQTCCDCANIKKESEAYEESGCASIEELCESVAKSGTGPVVVGGSRNEFTSSDCFCGQNTFLSIGKPTSIIANVKGSKRRSPIKVLVEIIDSKGKKVFSNSTQDTFNAFLMADGVVSGVSKVSALKLSLKQAATVQVPVKLKKGTATGNGVVNVIFFVEHPKTKKKMILKKERRSIKIK